MLPILGTYTFGMASARQEGFFNGIGRAFRNNNPGDIAWDGDRGFAAAHGATRGDVGPNTPMAVFPTLSMGWAAQAALLSAPARFANDNPVPLRSLIHGYLGARIEQVIYRYCPPEGPGNSLALTETYVRNVCEWIGCKRTDSLTIDMLLPRTSAGTIGTVQASGALHTVSLVLSAGRLLWLVLHPSNWRREWQRLRRTVTHYRALHVRARSWLTAFPGPWDNTSPGDDHQEEKQMTKVLDDLGIDAVRVDEVRTYANSPRVTIGLAIVGPRVPTDSTFTLFMDTEDSDVIAQVKLGEVISLKEPETVDLQANAFTDFFTKSLPGFFGKHITVDETKAAEQAVIAFVGKDGLALAVDAVQYVEAKYANVTSTDATKADKLAEAVTKFKGDAEAAKKDLTTLGAAALNFVIEGALQVAISEAVKVAATVAIAAQAEPAA